MLKFKIQTKVVLNGVDVCLLLAITSLSFITRFWLLHHPDAVVFDEVHFGNFTNWYTKSEFFYDIHPPLGKMVMFLFANLSEYNGNIDFSGNYGRSFRDSQYIILRITPAFFSSLCAPLIYLALRFDSFSHCAAFISSFMMICDSSLLTEHRFILSDGMLHFFTCLFICVFSYTNSLEFLSDRWVCFMVLSGFSLGAACSSKNTAWGLMPYAAFIQAFQNFQLYTLLDIQAYEMLIIRGSLLAAPLILTYVGSFVIHFIILPFSGQGTPYLPQMMQTQLVNRKTASSEVWAKRLTKPNMFIRIVQLSIGMHRGNMGIKQFHGAQSRPINWPLLTGNYVGFWHGASGEINCMGNVFVYYFAFFSLIFNVLAFFRPKWDLSIRYFVGWVVCYFPFFAIPRSMYLYHYLIPLMFGCMSAGSTVDIIFSRKWVGIMLVFICCLCFFGYLIWSPYSYGIRRFDKKISIWTENWIIGDQYHRDLQAKSK